MSSLRNSVIFPDQPCANNNSRWTDGKDEHHNRIHPAGPDPESRSAYCRSVYYRSAYYYRSLLLFAVLLVIYLITLAGNQLISVTIFTRPALGSPMYIFLSYLSMIDGFYISSTAPKLIFDLISGKNTISFSGCMTQVFAEHFFAGAKIVLLIVMAYDRYVAICKSLHYMTVITDLCVLSWLEWLGL